MVKETILVLGAHNDDPIFGAGGTLAKYAKQGHKIRTVIFTYGEMSPPDLKPEIVIKTRIKESLISDKIIGGKGITYLGLKEPSFLKEIKQSKIKQKVKNIIKKENPSKIFTHGPNDAHPAHMAVYNLIKEFTKNGTIKCDVYSFDVWSVVRIRNRIIPRLLVDVTSTFDKKIKAIKSHKSQVSFLPAQFLIPAVIWGTYLKDKLNGYIYHCKYAEVFDKLN